MSDDKHNKKHTKRHVLLILLVGLLLSAGFGLTRIGDEPASSRQTGSASESAATEEPKELHATILCSGDTIMHLPVVQAAYTGEGYDFSPSFTYLKPYVEEADLAFVVMEAPLVESNFTGYPTFRCPQSFAGDLKDIGYDVLICSHNHTNDAGEEGIFHTIDVVRENGLQVAGLRASEEEPRYTLTRAGDLNVAIIPYTYGGGAASNRDLNGNPLSAAALPCVNTFNNYLFDEDFLQIQETVTAAREAGADFVIVYYHWGEEYMSHSNETQQMIAERTARETDADFIIGSHPHVPQEASSIDRSDADYPYSGLDTVQVYYSMGNIISNQRREVMGGRLYTEDGYMVSLDITYQEGSKDLIAIDSTPIPYWVDKSGNSPSYMIIPLTEGYQDNEYLQASGHGARAEEALGDLQRILAGE